MHSWDGTISGKVYIHSSIGGPYLNFSEYFSNAFLAMVNYPGEFKYVLRREPQSAYLNFPAYFSNVLFGDG